MDSRGKRYLLNLYIYCIRYRGDDNERESLKIRFVRNLNEDSTLLSELVMPNAVVYIVRANMIIKRCVELCAYTENDFAVISFNCLYYIYKIVTGTMPSEIILYCSLKLVYRFILALPVINKTYNNPTWRFDFFILPF